MAVSFTSCQWLTLDPPVLPLLPSCVFSNSDKFGTRAVSFLMFRVPDKLIKNFSRDLHSSDGEPSSTLNSISSGLDEDCELIRRKRFKFSSPSKSVPAMLRLKMVLY